mmetsp:Transcript_1405/g.2901  ORF Transcript_1405/g.2901 Transcript_1405/m.2901 type:complete len:260 (+) Transcript_1405:1030-1809(+)
MQVRRVHARRRLGGVVCVKQKIRQCRLDLLGGLFDFPDQKHRVLKHLQRLLLSCSNLQHNCSFVDGIPGGGHPLRVSGHSAPPDALVVAIHLLAQRRSHIGQAQQGRWPGFRLRFPSLQHLAHLAEVRFFFAAKHPRGVRLLLGRCLEPLVRLLDHPLHGGSLLAAHVLGHLPHSDRPLHQKRLQLLQGLGETRVVAGGTVGVDPPGEPGEVAPTDRAAAEVLWGLQAQLHPTVAADHGQGRMLGPSRSASPGGQLGSP